MANFCSNNSDGRIWAFCSTYLTLDMDNPEIGLIHFVKKKLLLFCTTCMSDFKITYIVCVVDNAYAVYHCKSCFIKLSIIATSHCFSRKCPYKYSKQYIPVSN